MHYPHTDTLLSPYPINEFCNSMFAQKCMPITISRTIISVDVQFLVTAPQSLGHDTTVDLAK